LSSATAILFSACNQIESIKYSPAQTPQTWLKIQPFAELHIAARNFILTISAYFHYLLSGLTKSLWTNSIWFSENDVLHLGLIAWMFYIAGFVANRVQDEAETGLVIPAG
jgi:hypothetical protein